MTEAEFLAEIQAFMKLMKTQLPQGKTLRIRDKEKGLNLRVVWYDRGTQEAFKILDGHWYKSAQQEVASLI